MRLRTGQRVGVFDGATVYTRDCQCPVAGGDNIVGICATAGKVGDVARGIKGVHRTTDRYRATFSVRVHSEGT